MCEIEHSLAPLNLDLLIVTSSILSKIYAEPLPLLMYSPSLLFSQNFKIAPRRSAEDFSSLFSN